MLQAWGWYRIVTGQDPQGRYRLVTACRSVLADAFVMAEGGVAELRRRSCGTKRVNGVGSAGEPAWPAAEVAAENRGDRKAGWGAVVWLVASVQSNWSGGVAFAAVVEAAKAITASLQRREMPQVEQPKQRRKPR